jgi:hypothetical protein
VSAGPTALRTALRAAALSAALCIGAAAPAAAQAADTLRPPPQDTLAVPDEVRPPPPSFPRYRTAPDTDWAAGVWHYDREALLREGALSLRELLERIPGVTTFRAGRVLQPEAAVAFGGPATRVEVERDGFVLDPLDASAIDLSRVSLVELHELTIERRTDLLRIRMRSVEAFDGRPYSLVEAGLGQPDVNVFRGTFLAPDVIIGPLGLAVDRIESPGELNRQPADVFAGWAKWSLLSERRGLQLELNQSTVNRDPDSPYPASYRRRDLLLRGRTMVGDGLIIDAYAGSSSLAIESRVGLPPGDTVRPGLDRSSRQLGIRAAWRGGGLEADGALRHRTHAALPALQAELGAGAGIADLFRVRAGLVTARAHGGGSAAGYHLRAAAGPLAGVRVFGELAGGDRFAPRYRADPPAVEPPDENGHPPKEPAEPDATLPGPARADVSSARLGAELRLRGLRAGAALVRVRTDSAPTWGLPFDSTAAARPGGDVTGWEASARLDLARRQVALETTLLNWVSGSRWVYMPAQAWRAGIEVHTSPLPSGNLEVLARLDLVRRGSTAVPAASGDALATLDAQTVVQGYLFIRILDVRIFARIDDWAGQETADLDGRALRGPRITYGVRWNFWN